MKLTLVHLLLIFIAAALLQALSVILAPSATQAGGRPDLSRDLRREAKSDEPVTFPSPAVTSINQGEEDAPAVPSLRTHSGAKPSLHVLAWYYPQFYHFPENDVLGANYTEWSNFETCPERNFLGDVIKKPSTLGFYDLRNRTVRSEQAKLAQTHSVDGFIYYHYWLNNRPVMNEVLDLRIIDGEPALPFAVAWANEEWQRQSLFPLCNASREHFEYLLPFFKHADYITINLKPIFLVYRMDVLTKCEKEHGLDYLGELQRYARQSGLPHGLHVLQCLSHNGFNTVLDPRVAGGVEFSPNFAAHRLSRYVPPRYRAFSVPSAHQFSSVVLPRCLTGQEVHRGGLVGWDPTPRYHAPGESPPKGLVEQADWSSARFCTVTRHRLEQVVCDSNPHGINLYVLFAWNEWGEGAALEPNTWNGAQYLECVRTAVEGVRAGMRACASEADLRQSAMCSGTDLPTQLCQAHHTGGGYTQQGPSHLARTRSLE